MAVSNFATWWPTTAHVSLTTVKSCFETTVTESASTALSRGFFIIDKLFITFDGRTAISGLIVW